MEVPHNTYKISHKPEVSLFKKKNSTCNIDSLYVMLMVSWVPVFRTVFDPLNLRAQLADLT